MLHKYVKMPCVCKCFKNMYMSPVYAKASILCKCSHCRQMLLNCVNVPQCIKMLKHKIKVSIYANVNYMHSLFCFF